MLEAVDIPVDTVLPDGSVIVLDRGSSYGEYGLFDGYPMRMSAGEDDGSIESENWRYLIADSKDAADGRTRWGSKVVVGTELIGYSGLYNTDLMHANLGAEEDTIIYFTMERRNETGFKWFIPSNDEFVQMVGHQVPGISTDWYWTSCEVNITTAYIYTIQGTSTQLNKAYFGALLRLMRRI